MLQTQHVPSYHIAIAGADGVGKSSMTMKFVLGIFPTDYDPTIEDVFRKRIVIDKEAVYIEILDTATQSGWYLLLNSVIRANECFLLVYSITDRQSFEFARSMYRQLQSVKGTEPFSAIIVGNKCDLEHDRQVSTQEGKDLAEECGCQFIETSAKTALNVEQPFVIVVRETIQRKSQEREARQQAEKSQELNRKKKKRFSSRLRTCITV
ncbi:ras-like protein 3 [Cytidiella melzeri]|nr:ras-like protein 3 [Cytidiella melzeri]